MPPSSRSRSRRGRSRARVKVVTVTPNPAIDQTVWIPRFRAGAVNRVVCEKTNPGGGGVNVASDLARFGVPVLATGLLGVANAGPFEALLADEGVVDAFIRVEGTTRTNVTIVDDETEATTVIDFPGFAVAPGKLRALRAAVGAACTGNWVVLTGSLPAGVAPETYGDLIGLVHERGGQVALDTSGAALAAGITAAPALVKPNRVELEELLGRSLDDRAAVVAAAWELIDTGITTVVVSLGHAGALFVRAEEAVFAAALPVQVASTVGAGDAMVAGTVAGVLQGLDLGQVAALATAFSAVTIMSVGPHLEPEGVRAIVGRVQLERHGAPRSRGPARWT